MNGRLILYVLDISNWEANPDLHKSQLLPSNRREIGEVFSQTAQVDSLSKGTKRDLGKFFSQDPQSSPLSCTHAGPAHNPGKSKDPPKSIATL